MKYYDRKSSTIIRYLAVSIGVTIYVSLWALSLLTEWGSDYGFYYASSYFEGEGHQLYKELFDHKGPVFYSFIQFVSLFIGWGYWQSYVTLILSVLVFYLPFALIIIKKSSNNFIVLFLILSSLTILHGQPTNSSISFFQGGLLAVAFYFLVASKKNNYKYGLSVLFFSLACLTRIDAIVYAPVFFAAIVAWSISSRSYVVFFRYLVLFILIPVLLFVIYMLLYGFSAQEYLLHNVVFNSWYNAGSSIYYLYRPEQFRLMMVSFVVLPAFVVLVQQYINNYKSMKFTDSSFGQIIESDQFDKVITLLIVLLGFSLWVLIKSDKNYHLITLLTPFLFYLSYWSSELIKNQNVLVALFPFLLYSLLLTIASKGLLKFNECSGNIYCKDSSISSYKQTIELIKSSEDAIIVGGRGWTYFYSGKKPIRPINDWWLYYKEEPFLTDYLKNAHNDLLAKSDGYVFWIDNGLLKNISQRSELFKEVLANSVYIEDEGRYSRYRISK